MNESNRLAEVAAGRSPRIEQADVRTYLWTAGALVGLFFGVVPVLALVGYPPKLLVVAAGLGYLGGIVVTGTVFEGLCSAVLVLAVLDVRLATVPAAGIASFRLMLVDPAIVLFGAVLAVTGRYRALLSRPKLDARTTAGLGLVVFVCWTFLAAYVGNGPSRAAALAFAVMQLRYLAVFGVAVVVARRTNVWCALSPLLLAVTANLAVALLQVINGGGFGLGALGETPTVILGEFALLGSMVPYGSYAGGLVGHSREFTLILLLFIPLVVGVAASRSWASLPLALGIVAAAVLVVRTADTDAGWAALFVTLGLLAVYLLYYALDTGVSPPVALPVLVGGGILVIGTALATTALAVLSPDGGGVPLLGTDSLAVRLRQNRAALGIAAAHPVFGIGGENYYLVADTLGLPDNRGIHNILFSYLAATGVVGVGSYLVAVLSVLGLVARRAVASTADYRLLWGGLCCGMVGFVAYASWDLAALWDAANAVFWMLAGIAVGSNARSIPTGASTPTRGATE